MENNTFRRWHYSCALVSKDFGVSVCVCVCDEQYTTKIEENKVTICIVDFPFIYNVIKITNACDHRVWHCSAPRRGNIVQKLLGRYLTARQSALL